MKHLISIFAFPIIIIFVKVIWLTRNKTSGVRLGFLGEDEIQCFN